MDSALWFYNFFRRLFLVFLIGLVIFWVALGSPIIGTLFGQELSALLGCPVTFGVPCEVDGFWVERLRLYRGFPISFVLTPILFYVIFWDVLLIWIGLILLTYYISNNLKPVQKISDLRTQDDQFLDSIQEIEQNSSDMDEQAHKSSHYLIYEGEFYQSTTGIDKQEHEPSSQSHENKPHQRTTRIIKQMHKSSYQLPVMVQDGLVRGIFLVLCVWIFIMMAVLGKGPAFTIFILLLVVITSFVMLWLFGINLRGLLPASNKGSESIFNKINKLLKKDYFYRRFYLILLMGLVIFVAVLGTPLLGTFIGGVLSKWFAEQQWKSSIYGFFADILVAYRYADPKDLFMTPIIFFKTFKGILVVWVTLIFGSYLFSKTREHSSKSGK